MQILRELGELGSVSAVAESLYVTPSAISQQLRLLQRAIPVPLTERIGRRLVLTDAGRALASAAAEVATALARAQGAVDAFVDAPGAPVTVAAFHSAAATLFPPLLRSSAAVSLADEDVAQVDFPALTARYDVVVAHRLDHTPPWPDGLAVTALMHEPLDVAMPDHHRLASKARVTPRDVAAEQWIAVHDGFPVFGTIEAIALAANRQIDIAHRVNEFSVVAELVAAGGGLALMPRWTTRPRPGLVLRPLSGIAARRHIDALCRPERAVRRSVAAVLGELRRIAAEVRRR